MLRDISVGVVANHTSLINGTHLVDSLVSSGIRVVRIFSPEHGFRGTADAGAHIEDGVDPATGINVVSLYGSNRKPQNEQMEGIDIILFDIQDVGSPFLYIYINFSVCYGGLCGYGNTNYCSRQAKSKRAFN